MDWLDEVADVIGDFFFWGSPKGSWKALFAILAVGAVVGGIAWFYFYCQAAP